MVIYELGDTQEHWGVRGSTGEHTTTRRKKSSAKPKAGLVALQRRPSDEPRRPQAGSHGPQPGLSVAWRPSNIERRRPSVPAHASRRVRRRTPRTGWTASNSTEQRRTNTNDQRPSIPTVNHHWTPM